MAAPRRPRRTCYTTLVLEALRAADDFRTARQLADQLKADVHVITVTLYHLKNSGVIDLVTDQNSAFWFFVSLESDRRSFTLEERALEVTPRRRKRRASPPTKEPS